MKRWDVLGFGAVAVDDLVYLDRYPQADEKMPIRGKARDGGGLAGTALVTAAKLGATAAWAGVLGFDELSRLDARCLQQCPRRYVARGPLWRGAADPLDRPGRTGWRHAYDPLLFRGRAAADARRGRPRDDRRGAGRLPRPHDRRPRRATSWRWRKHAGVPTVADLERLRSGRR